MILFFTGTGNSRYIARRIADSLGDELLDMNKRIKAWDTSEINTEARLAFCRSDLRLAHSAHCRKVDRRDTVQWKF